MKNARASKWIAMARLAALFARFRLREPWRRRRSLQARLAMLPTRNLPLQDAVNIRWNEFGVPHLSARSDRDLAVGLGVVHAHLRLFQMEAMRRLAAGRLSELIGPLALDVDRTLRIVGFTRAVPEIERLTPPSTLDWLDGFCAGINAVIDQADAYPEEFRLLGLRPARWSRRDVLGIGRLAASDFSWKVLHRLVPHRERADWPEAWQRLIEEGGSPVPSFAGGSGRDSIEETFGRFNRGGSNSLAIAAERSATGSALIASDPHLGVMLPNAWLIAGMRAPGIHAVGLMIPGVPIVALGRNADIAWGGTSLHAASSDLFDLADLPEAEITTREERISVRWGSDETVSIRETAYGPIVSDAPLLGMWGERPIAMRWIGHDPNDELTAMLNVARAKNWRSFRAALDGFAAPAQNMVYADVGGIVGRAVAAHLPRRPPGPPADVVQRRELLAHWQRIVTGGDFPASFAPPEGFIASANNRPPASDAPVGFFFSPEDRVQRMAALVEAAGIVSPDMLRRAQQDIVTPSAVRLQTTLLALIEAGPAQMLPVSKALTEWNGRHSAESSGALALELMVYHLLHQLHDDSALQLYFASWDLWALLRRDLEELPQERLRKAASAAAEAAQPDFQRHGTWGTIHRLRLEHPLASVPKIGARYKFTDDPVGGGNETLMKTSHGVSHDVHKVGLGAVARHISDLSDPDANDFCLLGGQDGWLGSANFLDQYPLWRDGRYIRVPMSEQAVLEGFSHLTTLQPVRRSGESVG
jgi:penicillin G amidase